jgi:hypothetical protein
LANASLLQKAKLVHSAGTRHHGFEESLEVFEKVGFWFGWHLRIVPH